MRISLSIIMLLVVGVFIGCNQGSALNPSEATFVAGDIVVEKRDEHEFLEIFNLNRIVRIGEGEEVLIGGIDKVIVNPKTEDIFVGDFEKSKAVFQFSEAGEFIQSFGVLGEGPAEFYALRDFFVTASGDVVIVGMMKMVRFDADGNVILEATFQDIAGKPSLGARQGLFHNGLYYCMNLNGAEAKSVNVVDESFNLVRSFHPMDKRDRLLSFPPTAYLTSYGNQIIIGDLFDLALWNYSADGTLLGKHQLAASQIKFDELQGLNPNDHGSAYFKYLKQVVRWDYVFGLEECVFLFKIDSPKHVFIPSLYFPNEKRLIEFGDLPFVRTKAGASSPVVLGDMVGRYQGQLIGYQWNQEDLEFMKRQFPQITDTDKPYLFFFSPKMDLVRKN